MYESLHSIHSDCIKMNIAKHTFKHSIMFTYGTEYVDSESAIYRTVCSRKIYYISATLSITSIRMCVFSGLSYMCFCTNR